MYVPHFLEDIKVQRFCLTLVGEARLWYQSLEPVNVDWQGLQNLFRQQYSKIGNIREQLFHALRTSHYDENTKTIDTYVTCTGQVATLLGYEEPQILEVFKNTLPTTLYWVLFPIENLRQVLETVKRMLTKENIDRQLARQSSSTPVMSVRDTYNKRVTFNTQDGPEDKIDKFTEMMGKLVARDSEVNRPFKPQVYQSKQRGHSRNSYDLHNYDRWNYQNKYRSNSGERRIQFNRQGRGRPSMNKIIEEEILEAKQGHIKILEDRIAEENIEVIIGMKVTAEREVGIDLEKGHFQEIIVVIIERTIKFEQ